MLLMPITTIQKKARKSRGNEMLSDIENLDIMLGGIDPEREESEFSNFVRRPESSSYNKLVNQEANYHSNSREDEIRVYAGNDRN